MCIRTILLATAVGLSIALSAAAVPPAINYQGRLTDDLNQPVADAAYTITFHIYENSSGGTPLWSETQNVTTATGLFEVMLGAVTPVGLEVFDGSTRFLALAISGQAESAERVPLVSVPYAMVAGSVAGTTTDCHDCDTIFINAVGPETLTATSRTGFTVLNSGPEAREGIIAALEGESTDTVSAIVCSVSNNGTGAANGGAFTAYSSFNAPINGLYSIAQTATSTYAATGIYAVGKNFGAGSAIGGRFYVPSGGSGYHIGVDVESSAGSIYDCYGIRASAINSGGGPSYAGFFRAESYSPGLRYGVFGSAITQGDDDAIGVHGHAQNTGFGRAIGGDFAGASGGSGSHYGVYSISAANTDSLSVGVQGIGTNFGSGTAYGGVLQATGGGTGLHAGLFASATSTSSSAWGIYGFGSSTGAGAARGAYNFGQGYGSGDAHGAYMYCMAMGTGEGRGLKSYVYGGDDAPIIAGADVEAYGATGFAGTAYGSYSYVHGPTTAGNQYGLYSLSRAATSASSYGVYGRSEQSGSGSSYGGYFLADSSGTGQSRGARAVALTKGDATAYGVMGVSANRSTGDSYGGYFEALNYSGTGTHYGIYAVSPTSGYAGYFSGNIRVTGNQTVLGTKSAAVEIEPADYRLVYSQESPECWFEDFGEGQLVNGRTHIELDPLFLQTVTIDDANPMKVFVQLNDPDCNGTAVLRGATGFDVVELQNGNGNASFSYRIVAKRRGYEDVRLDLMPGLAPEEISARVARDRAAMLAGDEQTQCDYLKQQESRSRRGAEEPPSLSGTEPQPDR